MQRQQKNLQFKLDQLYRVEKEELKKPIIKIVGIENIFSLELKELEKDINIRNFSNLQQKGKILHLTNKNKMGKQSVIMEVTSDLHKHIKENKNRLFVGYQNCRVFDVINVKPCYNCGRFGHSGTKCKNSPTCLKCAGTHLTKNCNGADLCCANCSFSNNKFGKIYNTNHTVYDSEACEILKSKIKKCINTTDYSVKPDSPRYFGKVENFNRDAQEVISPRTNTRNLTFGGSTESLTTRDRFGSSTSMASSRM